MTRKDLMACLEKVVYALQDIQGNDLLSVPAENLSETIRWLEDELEVILDNATMVKETLEEWQFDTPKCFRYRLFE